MAIIRQGQINNNIFGGADTGIYQVYKTANMNARAMPNGQPRVFCPD